LKKIIKKIKKLNNRGSSIVMVIVALAFIGILVGALLTAAGYSYRLKMQDLNSRDNFYYVEQAMNEIYAGVGSQTVSDLQEAYIYTVENMVEYDLTLEGYAVNKTDEELEEMFHDRFMNNILNNPFFSDPSTIGTELSKFISNDSVVLDADRLYMVTTPDPDDPTKIAAVTIKNVTLTRTQEYDKSVANGTYTQTVTADIEIAEPDFAVLFDSVNSDYANIFKYSVVADMGVEVNQPGVPVTIAGDVYAASDYYNKRYNESTYDSSVSDEDKLYEKTYTDQTYTYTHGSVTSRSYTDEDNHTYYSNPDYAIQNGQSFNGLYDNSMYSGFYIDNTSVSILADTIIVPGSLSVMNSGSLSVYGKEGKVASEAEIWVDDFILGGYSTKKAETKTVNGTTETVDTYKGSSAVMRADLYVKDDTEINAAGANFQLRGNYYGFGDSTTKDERTFLPTVALENFQIDVVDADGNTVQVNRGHYNSSAIIVNGEQSTIDLSLTQNIFLAGRSYIELSKNVAIEEGNATIGTGEDTEVLPTVKETYTFMPTTDDLLSDDPNDTVFLRDYKMGESLSLKSNQQAYIPIMLTGVPTPVINTSGVFQGYWEAELAPSVVGIGFFEKYFPEDIFNGSAPAIVQEVSGKKYYYYDFERAYDIYWTKLALGGYDTPYSTLADFESEFENAEEFAAGFIHEYAATLNLSDDEAVDRANPNYPLKEYLVDIGNFEDFDAGEIKLPTAGNIYSSGAITTKEGVAFNVVRADNSSDASILFSSIPYNTTDAAISEAYQYSNSLELEYDYIRWNLGHYSNDADSEKLYIKDLLDEEDLGDSSITPINKFMNFDEIEADTELKPDLADAGDITAEGILDLPSGYSVWVSDEPVVIKARTGDEGMVRGIVITKHDVYFDSSVKSFEGLIVSGGKVYVNSAVTNLSASAEICRTILRECQLSSDSKCKTVLNLFKGYEVDESLGDETPDDDLGTPGDASEARTIDNIDYSDVVSFKNWMKNVE